MKPVLMHERALKTARHENDDPLQHQADTPVHSDTTPGQSEGVPSGLVTNTATSFQDAGASCIPDIEGRYGSSGDERSAQQIQYAYQLETKPDVSSDVVSSTIVPEIERHVSGIVVPLMFEEACARAAGGSTRRQTRRRRRLQAAYGFTPFPPDQILKRQCQGTLSSSENNCFVILGNATVYSENGLDQGMLERAQSFVAKGMDEGAFDKIHDGIVGVSSQKLASIENDFTLTRSTESDDSRNSAVIWGPIVGVIVVGVVIAALFVRRGYKKKRRQRQADADPLGIRPSTAEDYKHREFSVQTQSSWNVLAQNSQNSRKEELGISARELAHLPQDFNQSSRSSWDVLQQSSSMSGLPVLGISPTGIHDSRFVNASKPNNQEEKWEDESALTE